MRETEIHSVYLEFLFSNIVETKLKKNALVFENSPARKRFDFNLHQHVFTAKITINLFNFIIETIITCVGGQTSR